MFQMWGKLVENNHVLQDLTVCIDFDYLEIQITEE